jgi:hypothetical protein
MNRPVVESESESVLASESALALESALELESELAWVSVRRRH